MDQAADMGKWAFVPAFIGFWVGILFLLLLDKLIPHLHQGCDCAEGVCPAAWDVPPCSPWR